MDAASISDCEVHYEPPLAFPQGRVELGTCLSRSKEAKPWTQPGLPTTSQRSRRHIGERIAPLPQFQGVQAIVVDPSWGGELPATTIQLSGITK